MLYNIKGGLTLSGGGLITKAKRSTARALSRKSDLSTLKDMLATVSIQRTAGQPRTAGQLAVLGKVAGSGRPLSELKRRQVSRKKIVF